jgi:hypothetical protein
MKTFSLLLFASLMVLAGCHPQPNAGRKAVQEENPSNPMKEKTNSSSENAGGKETCLGPTTVRGKLYHTKGRMGEVNGFILSGLYLTGENGAWKPEYEALAGKEVEVKGVHYRYVCGPIEQCLEGGVINYLREIEYLRAAD